MENITIKINGMEVSAPKGSTILEAARLAHIEIPTLCFLKEINEIGACRICVVEVKGRKKPGGFLRIPDQRRHGSMDQHSKGTGVPQENPAASAFQP